MKKLTEQNSSSTKHIKQRDEDFILAYFQEENYRKEFTNALRDYVDMGNFRIKSAAYSAKIRRKGLIHNAGSDRKPR